VRRLRKEYFEFPDPSLVGFGTVSTVKRQLSAGEYCLHIQDRAVEVEWIKKKVLNSFGLLKHIYTFPESITIVPILLLI
jgi:hypothetical protein